MDNKNLCLFCGSTFKTIGYVPSTTKKDVLCPVCGIYRITDQALNCEPTFTKEERVLFSGYIRRFSTKNTPLEISSNTFNDVPKLVEKYKTLPVDEKIKMFITFLAKSSSHIGELISVNPQQDFTRFFCKSANELIQIVKHLRKISLIAFSRGEIKAISLTIPGWEKYEKLKEINLESKKAFIAMSFDENLKYIFDEAIEPACKECGFEAIRIDLVHHNEKICDKIIAEIKESRFLIADFTGQKHGVYFEAGFAQGLGIKVIWSCKDDEKDKLHFDTRQYNHIIWTNTQDFKNQLINRIKALIK